MKKNILKKLKNKIIVSCQPNEGGPQDKTSIVVSMAEAAIIGGCGGVRIEGEKNIRAVKKNISLPIIGIIKNDLDNFKVIKSISISSNKISDITSNNLEIKNLVSELGVFVVSK